MATLKNREEVLLRVLLALDKLSETIPPIKDSIALAIIEGELQAADKDEYKDLERALDRFISEGIVQFLANVGKEELAKLEPFKVGV